MLVSFYVWNFYLVGRYFFTTFFYLLLSLLTPTYVCFLFLSSGYYVQ